MRILILAVLGTTTLATAGCGGTSEPIGPDAGDVHMDDAPNATCPAPGQSHIFVAMGGKTWQCTSPELTDSVTCTWKNPEMLADGQGDQHCVAVCSEPNAGINCTAESFVLSPDQLQINCRSVAGLAITCRSPST